MRGVATTNAFKKQGIEYVRSVLDRTGLSASELARAVKVSTTTLTRPLNDKTHKHAVGGGTLQKIAEYMGEPLQLGASPAPRLKAKSKKPPAVIQILSHVGAGDEVYPYNEPFDEIDAPPGMHEGWFALRIKGRSLEPRFYAGEVLVCSPAPDVRDLLNDTAVVDLEDGRRYLKIITKGDRGQYTLKSINGPTIFNVRVVAGARIEWHKPR